MYFYNFIKSMYIRKVMSAEKVRGYAPKFITSEQAEKILKEKA